MKSDKHKLRVAQFLQEHPEMRDRKYLHQIVAILTGVPIEKQVEVKTVLRRAQEAIPNDLKGATLEREWREERGQESVSEMCQEAVLGMKVISLNGQKYLVKSN